MTEKLREESLQIADLDAKLNPAEYHNPERYPLGGGPAFTYWTMTGRDGVEHFARIMNDKNLSLVVTVNGRPVHNMERKGFKQLLGDDIRANLLRRIAEDEAREAAKEGKPDPLPPQMPVARPTRRG